MVTDLKTQLYAKLKLLPQYTTLQSVSKVLIDHGYKAYLAGGAVRDLIIDRAPHDFDIATDAKPEVIESLFKKTIPVGKKFGIIVVVVDQLQIEVATFRKDGVYKDSRHPENIEFSEPEYDAQRRDFTINAMFLDLKSGELIDFVGGFEDLKNKLIKTVGDPNKRFAEDSLRLMRAIRFACDLGFAIDPVTEKSIIDNFQNVTSISRERILIELLKTFQNLYLLQNDKILLQSRFFETLFGNLNYGSIQELIHLLRIFSLGLAQKKTEFFDYLQKLKNTTNLSQLFVDEVVLWIILLKNQSPSFDSEGFLKQQKCSNKIIQMTKQSLKMIKLFEKTELQGRITGELILEAHQEGSLEAMYVLYELGILRAASSSDESTQSNAKVVGLNMATIKSCLLFKQLPAPFLNGHDFLNLGVKGMALGQLQKQIYFLQLEGKIVSKLDALEYAQKLFGAYKS